MLSSHHQKIQKFQHLEVQLRKHMSLYGYSLLETPIIQDADLFLTKAGDKIINKLLTFERHGRQFALRPEFTALAAKYYVKHCQDEIVRWQVNGSIFEDEHERGGQSYQQLSIGAELIGLSGTLADAEIISMAALGLLDFSFEWNLVVGHAGFLRHLLFALGIDNLTYRFLLRHRYALRDPQLGADYILEQAESLLHLSEDRLTTTEHSGAANAEHLLDVLLDTTKRGQALGGRTRRDIAERLLAKRDRALERDLIVRAVELLQQWTTISTTPDAAFTQIEASINGDVAAKQLLQNWKKTLELVVKSGIPENKLIIQPDLARVWDYYTGVVFGIRLPDGKYVAGGGRYDGLIRLVGGSQDVPAVGFAYYADTLLDILAIEVPQPGNTPVALLFDNADDADVSWWAYQLRNNGIALEILPKHVEFTSPSLAVTSENQAVFNGLYYTTSQLDELIAVLKDSPKP